MGVINQGSFGKDLLPFFGKWFGDEYKDHPTFYDRIFKVDRMNSKFEEEPLTSGFGLPSEIGDGGAVSYDSAQQGYTKRYTATKYGNGFIITKDMVDDGIALAKGERFARSLKRGMMIGREVLAANVLNNAFTSTYAGGDGKELCATDHPTQYGTLSNEPATAADLSEAALEQMYVDLMEFKDDRGLRIAVNSKKLVIPTALKFEASRLLKSALQPGTANNDINAVRDAGLISEVVVNPYLSDSDAWFVTTDAPDGLKLKMRRDIDLSMENDFDTENAKFKSIMRLDVGWTDPRGVYGSPGA